MSLIPCLARPWWVIQDGPRAGAPVCNNTSGTHAYQATREALGSPKAEMTSTGTHEPPFPDFLPHLLVPTISLPYHPPYPPTRAAATTHTQPRTYRALPPHCRPSPPGLTHNATRSTISIRNTQHHCPQKPANRRLHHSRTVTPGALYHAQPTTASVPRRVLSGFNGFRASGSEVGRVKLGSSGAKRVDLQGLPQTFSIIASGNQKQFCSSPNEFETAPISE
ncbi:hypothetical protein K458DRAFT_398817 [Lentithecium fluviatile CBS 122367]|uniref:Uncharacterized protein n=1 Tax=Lentithecium fluviatile CBS 122367 TaxID=1168545 RepID=A0A6G1JK97_9PLEO|nr:hypothetical protein K458DRAFT_398817 [Lentithecium fluviatile CBS 122367]